MGNVEVGSQEQVLQLGSDSGDTKLLLSETARNKSMDYGLLPCSLTPTGVTKTEDRVEACGRGWIYGSTTAETEDRVEACGRGRIYGSTTAEIEDIFETRMQARFNNGLPEQC